MIQFRIPDSLQNDPCKVHILVVKMLMLILCWNTLWPLGEPQCLRTSEPANWRLLPLRRNSTLYLPLRDDEQFSVNVREFFSILIFSRSN